MNASGNLPQTFTRSWAEKCIAVYSYSDEPMTQMND